MNTVSFDQVASAKHLPPAARHIRRDLASVTRPILDFGQGSDRASWSITWELFG